MTDDLNKKTPSRRKKFLKFILIRFPIILLVLVGVLYATLKLIERYPVPLREGFEQHLSQVTGANASIGSLEKFSFVPSIHVDIRDVTIHRAGNAAQIDIKADKIKLMAPFFSSILGLNKFKEVEIENVIAKEGALLPKALNINKMQVVDSGDTDEDNHALTIDGLYNGKILSIAADVEKWGDIYKIKSEIPIRVTFDNAILTGTIERKLTSVELTGAVLEVDNNISTANDYVLVKSKEYNSNNPLACLILYGDVNECKEYLNKEKNVSE